eukprot:scaffold68228_cov68-Phaeocystis_antarctica.AAC.3
MTERWPWYAAFMSAVLLPGKSTLAPRFNSSLAISRWSWDAAVCSRLAERVDRPSLAQPAGHLPQLASPGRLVDLNGQRGGRAHCGLASVRRGGRRGGGRLWRRYVLPGELRSGRLALDLGPLRCGAAVLAVNQLGGGPGE